MESGIAVIYSFVASVAYQIYVYKLMRPIILITSTFGTVADVCFDVQARKKRMDLLLLF